MAKKQAQNKKSQKILLATLIPLGVIAAATAITLPLVLNKKDTTKTLQQIVDEINNVLELKTKCNTMLEAIDTVKSTYDVEAAQLGDNQQFVWDQAANRFIVLDKDDKLVFGPKDYTLNENKWQLWKMVSESNFDSNNQYSQYLKSSTTNEVKSDYTFIAGFDAGKNTNVKYAKYNYDSSVKTSKDIIINTNSKYTNVSILAWNGDYIVDGDVIMHYGTVGDLNITSNDSFIENGNAITCTIDEGSVTIDPNSKIALTYVTTTGVTLNQYKSGTDLVYAKTDEIKQELKSKVAVKEVQDEKTFAQTKEDKHATEGIVVEHAFTVSDGTTYDTLAEISAASNASQNPELFEGKTITLNKDYVMSATEAAAWTPICNDEDDEKGYAKAFKGTFDGQGHTIVGFDTNVSFKALFGSIRGEVKNISFADSTHTTTSGGGNAILACMIVDGGSVDNVHARNCKVVSNGSSGLIISWVDGSADLAKEVKISNCSTDDKCSIANTGGNQTGGIVGQVCNINKISLLNLINNASITGVKSVGGIVGQFGSNTGQSEFVNCVNNGTITLSQHTGTTFYVGGLVGYFNNGGGENERVVSFTECTNTGTVTTANTTTYNIKPCGGFVGYTNNFTLTLTNCVNTGVIGLIQGQESTNICNQASGFVGYNNGNVLEKYIDCTNAGTIHALTAVAHFSAVKQSDATQFAENCNITLGTLVDTNLRVKIAGEPE